MAKLKLYREEQSNVSTIFRDGFNYIFIKKLMLLIRDDMRKTLVWYDGDKSLLIARDNYYTIHVIDGSRRREHGKVKLLYYHDYDAIFLNVKTGKIINFSIGKSNYVYDEETELVSYFDDNYFFVFHPLFPDFPTEIDFGERLTAEVTTNGIIFHHVDDFEAGETHIFEKTTKMMKDDTYVDGLFIYFDGKKSMIMDSPNVKYDNEGDPHELIFKKSSSFSTIDKYFCAYQMFDGVIFEHNYNLHEELINGPFTLLENGFTKINHDYKLWGNDEFLSFISDFISESKKMPFYWPLSIMLQLVKNDGYLKEHLEEIYGPGFHQEKIDDQISINLANRLTFNKNKLNFINLSTEIIEVTPWLVSGKIKASENIDYMCDNIIFNMDGKQLKKFAKSLFRNDYTKDIELAAEESINVRMTRNGRSIKFFLNDITEESLRNAFDHIDDAEEDDDYWDEYLKRSTRPNRQPYEPFTVSMSVTSKLKWDKLDFSDFVSLTVRPIGKITVTNEKMVLPEDDDSYDESADVPKKSNSRFGTPTEPGEMINISPPERIQPIQIRPRAVRTTSHSQSRSPSPAEIHGWDAMENRIRLPSPAEIRDIMRGVSETSHNRSRSPSEIRDMTRAVRTTSHSRSRSPSPVRETTYSWPWRLPTEISSRSRSQSPTEMRRRGRLLSPSSREGTSSEESS